MRGCSHEARSRRQLLVRAVAGGLDPSGVVPSHGPRSDPLVRWTAVKLIPETRVPLSLLSRVTDDPDPLVRGRAIAALGG